MQVPFGFVPGQGGQCNSLHTSPSSHAALRVVKEPEWAAGAGALWRRSETPALGGSNQGVHFDTVGHRDWHLNMAELQQRNFKKQEHFLFLSFKIFWWLSKLLCSIQWKEKCFLI